MDEDNNNDNDRGMVTVKTNRPTFINFDIKNNVGNTIAQNEQFLIFLECFLSLFFFPRCAFCYILSEGYDWLSLLSELYASLLTFSHI